MDDYDPRFDLGMLCRCCDFNSYTLPEAEGFTDCQRQMIEDLCKLCLETSPHVVGNC